MVRIVKKINEQWEFEKQGERTVVSLPHTWNAEDGQTGPALYYRGACTYRRRLKKPALASGQQVYLEFRGVNSSALVRMNGKELARHDGGYSTFRVNVTDALEEDNTLEVLVDNAPNDRVYPQRADFTFYGGIYRDVYMIIADSSHFDLDDHGGSGFRITSEVSGDNAVVRFETYSVGEAEKIVVSIPGAGETELALETVDGKTYGRGSIAIPDVHKWDGVEDPYLYEATAALYRGGVAVDLVRERFGCREFRFDAEEGFFLNGRRYPLHGVSRHQDRLGVGNALTRKMHEEDMELILSMGANSIRLAHYQHDQYFYDLCDRTGMVVWAEIPYISEHMPDGRENTISQMKELIFQNYNHASIVCWGVSNEITISTKDKADMLDNHRVLNDLCHELDPSRFTTLACYAMCGPFNKSAHITDVVSWNLYLGWYVPGLFLNDLWMGFFHKVYPNRCIGYSEYGAEGMPNLHSAKPRRGDHTEEYQAVYHEYMVQFFEKNPYLWATHVWNMFDFAADARDQGGEPGMNHKGLVTFDRKTKKDSFYLYKAYWSSEPFVHICSKRFQDRTEDTITVKVYTNQDSVTLLCDGKEISSKKGGHILSFQVPVSGKHVIEAVSGDLRDKAVFQKTDRPNPSYKLSVKSSNSANWV